MWEVHLLASRGERDARRGSEDVGSEVTGADVASLDWTVAVYFISFVFVGAIIAINVVVSVMFEGFVSSLEADAASDRIEQEAAQHYKVRSPSYPLACGECLLLLILPPPQISHISIPCPSCKRSIT